MVTTKELESCTDQEKRLELLQAVAFELLKLDKSKDLSFLDVVDRYDNPALLQDLYFIAVYLCNKVSESNDLFFVPEIELDSDKDSKPSTVEKILSKSGDIELMESIVFVSMQTHNSYQEVLDMPFVVFQSYLKHIKVFNNISNPEWKQKYLQYKYLSKNKEDAKTNSRDNKALDYAGLQRFSRSVN